MQSSGIMPTAQKGSCGETGPQFLNCRKGSCGEMCLKFLLGFKGSYGETVRTVQLEGFCVVKMCELFKRFFHKKMPKVPDIMR